MPHHSMQILPLPVTPIPAAPTPPPAFKLKITAISTFLQCPPRSTRMDPKKVYKAQEQLAQPGLAEITCCPLSEFSTTVFTSLSEEKFVPNKCLESRLGAESGLYECSSRLPT
ncbi:hypothetical protein AVEN_1737-1 [Araneus ventricosus]|uniref:Uncharacterized protein n=1 Tax=Araneus ventricosus TaxID=182803 RepID=A0A4Y2IC92_ARAVE|nr:hypothetical protein AVEN_1737-1 [Araneus ventricosus]